MAQRKPNIVEYSDDGRVALLLWHKGTPLRCYLDAADEHLIHSTGSKWCAQWNVSGKTFYCVTYLPGPHASRKRVQMHQLVCPAPPRMVVDHHDHNGLNNTRLNLSAVTRSVNVNNLRSGKRVQKSGAYGVYRSGKRWRVSVCNASKLVHFGMFDDVALLGIGGSPVYLGPTAGIGSYFTDLGYVRKILRFHEY